MTNLEFIQSLDLEKMAQWLDEYDNYEDSPWADWWNKNFCSKCPSEIGVVRDSGREIEICYCELHDKCRFFSDRPTPNSKDIVSMWLEKAVNSG